MDVMSSCEQPTGTKKAGTVRSERRGEVGNKMAVEGGVAGKVEKRRDDRPNRDYKGAFFKD